ncbi:MAG TPA: DUF2726 domain-containing protein [Chthoniobacterales bacterium]|nr:DUF2726 domain-containing protein [Chthoniobacterales bacterium]
MLQNEGVAVLLGLLILLLVGALVLRGLIRLVSRRAESATPTISAVQAFAALPYARKKYFFSAAERSFYEILRRLVPGHTVFAKVRLADLVNVKKDAASWQSYFNRIDRKHLDFILCDSDLAPVVAIELDDRSHDDEERRARDLFVDRVLASVSLPIVRVRARHAYKLEDVRRMLSPHVRAQSPAGSLPADAAYMPQKGWRPAI